MSKQPCAKDCKRRTAECKKTCAEWQAYEAAKREEYKNRQVEAMLRETEFLMYERRRKVGCFLASETKPKRSGD